MNHEKGNHSPRSELGESGLRDLRSSVGDAVAVVEGDGDPSLTGRRWNDMKQKEKPTHGLI